MPLATSISNTPFAAAVYQEMEELLQGPGCHTLGVCGLGGSGKTTAARSAAEAMPDVAIVFQTDWYCAYTSAFRRGEVLAALENNNQEVLARWGNPTNWYDWPRMLGDLATLRAGGCISMADAWRQSSGERDLHLDLVRPGPNSVILVDGIYLLHPPVRDLLDRVVMIDVPPDTAHLRTGTRDGHRVDRRYLDFKQSIIVNFELPYFERYGSQITRRVS